MKYFLLFALLSLGCLRADTKTNSIGVEFVLIPDGSFMMGCDAGGEDCWEDEAPKHRVIISKSFYLGKYEVTQKQWKALMGNNPGKVKGDSLPVTNVSWNDAIAFIKKLNDKEGVNIYRLPSEAEWEYALRAGTNTTYFWGESGENSIANQYAWLNSNSRYEIQKTGQKKPNAWGLYDMVGNVWEWTNDFYREDYYQYSPITDPKGADEGVEKIIRGGSYEENTNFARSSYRHDGYYSAEPSMSSETVGFRLAMSAQKKMKETFRVDFGDFYANAYLVFDGMYAGGYIAVYEKKTDKNLINAEIRDIYAENVKDWQKFARENTIIIHEDFNFDGKKDFAIYCGEAHGDYLYNIYLHDAQGFTHNQAFSDLTNEGMFEIDNKNKKLLVTYQSRGRFAYQEIKPEGNKLKLYKELAEEFIAGPYIKHTQTIWNDDNSTKKSDWVELDFGYADGASEILSFVLEKSGKKVVIFIDGGNNINYALLDKNESVEFACPAYYDDKADGECGQTANALDFEFQEDDDKTTLSFTNKNTLYSIYQSDSDFGVTIQTKEGKTYEQKGKKGTLKGDLKDAINGENIVCLSCG
ncbi:MAG: formylglycine-generating enzyme family protein [Campylobacteraceae bacterium]|jgi:formylglycine-generating enzyme required for sulfatase activity|nr:formylglycine-generating enzyme family protein [Campylobacteraceae bacterium]